MKRNREQKADGKTKVGNGKKKLDCQIAKQGFSK